MPVHGVGRRAQEQSRASDRFSLIVGEKADTKFWSNEVYAKARQPKELFVVEGATHMDMYDKPQFVRPAVAKLSQFFGQHLTSA